jgi:hypothetical protein
MTVMESRCSAGQHWPVIQEHGSVAFVPDPSASGRLLQTG